MIRSLHIIVIGGVQGVGYRASTQKMAHRLKLDGWVRNLPDGSVEIHAHGATEQVEQLIAWCHKGPVFARVEKVIVADLDAPTISQGFIIT